MCLLEITDFVVVVPRPKPPVLRSVSLTNNPLAMAAASDVDVVVTSGVSGSDPLPSSWVLERQQLLARLEQKESMLQQKDSMIQQKESIIQHLQGQLHATDQSDSAWDMRPV